MKRFFLLVAIAISAIFTSCDTGVEKAEIVLTSPSEVVVGMYATEITINYNIKGAENAKADVSVRGSWARVTKHETAGVIVLETETNETGGDRMSAVTLSYEDSVVSVVITQLAEPIKPEITLLSDAEINIERCGTKVEVKYALKNTNPIDYIYAKTSADWIYSIDTEEMGVVVFGVATNTTGQSRSTKITVGYGDASFDVTLSQRGDGNINFNAPILSGEYYGDALTPGVGNYWFVLSDRGFDSEGKALANATYYRIDAYGSVHYANDGKIPVAEGRYTFDKNDTLAEGTFTAEYSGYWVTDKEGKRGDILTFESGELVVESGKITLDVVINGENHHVEYVGDALLEDARDSVRVYSTLNGDYEADLSDHTMVYECYGDYYEFGYTNWMFVIQPNDGEGDCFQFDIITGFKSALDGFYGSYKASDYLAKWSFIPGWTNNVQLLCSWYFTADQSEMAPFRDGNVSVVDNGDGTVTVEIDVLDDLRNRITGSWTGVPMSVN